MLVGARLSLLSCGARRGCVKSEARSVTLIMRYIKAITEHDMVAVFLKTEINSDRYSEVILALLRRVGADRKLVDKPDTCNQAENDFRIQLLGDFRGYKQNRDIFASFPADVAWHRVAINKQELARVKYIDYSYWTEISSGSRLPVRAAKNIHAGVKVFDQSTQGFLAAARALKDAAVLPRMILVGVDKDSDLVVLEGHVRLTICFVKPECLPDELEVIVGYSPNIIHWGAY